MGVYGSEGAGFQAFVAGNAILLDHLDNAVE
jgi:cytochrome b